MTAAERLDLHNTDVDEAAAAAQACGYQVRTTGAVCTRPARHPGPCKFTPRPAAERWLTGVDPRLRM